MNNLGLTSSLHKINDYIKSVNSNIPNTKVIREMLLEVGSFIELQKIINFSYESIDNRPIVAVDGSRVEYGSFYPYYFCLAKTLAKSTKEINGIDSITDYYSLTPLEEDVFNIIEKQSREKKMSIDESYKTFLKDNLAKMELIVAIKAIKKFNPSILLLDGGFLLFDKFPEWKELCEECVNKNIVLVGVIEEIATAEMAKWLKLIPPNRPRIYDRELLFGLLKSGEYFFSSNRVKKNYCTIFARLSSSPQAIACDFLPEQENVIDKTMNQLFTITSQHGQGIPFWLQIVDAGVRLRKKEMDRLIATCIERDIFDKYFKANRENRVF